MEDAQFQERCGPGNDGDYRLSAGRADLRGADLHGINLARVDLSGSVMAGADLRGTNLHQANLVGADLRRADLRDSDLRGANLCDADLREADLGAAKMSGSRLRRADLRTATWAAADLRWADLRWAVADGSLRQATGLDQAVQDLPSRDAEGQRPWRIGILYQSLSYPFVQALRRAVGAQARARGVEVVERDSGNDLGRERQGVLELLPQVDCLAFQAVDRDGSVASVEEANRAGVPVVQFNMLAHGGRRIAFAGPEHAESGELLCGWLKGFVESWERARPEGTAGAVRPPVLYLRGRPTQDSDFARNYALKACLKRDGLDARVELHERVANYDRAEARRVTRALQAGGVAPVAIIGNNDDMVLGALDALVVPRIREVLAGWAGDGRLPADVLPGIDGCPAALADLDALAAWPGTGDPPDLDLSRFAGCPEALAALRRACGRPAVALAGIDGFPEALEAIRAGWMGTTIYQNPAAQGAAAVDACLAYLEAEPGRRLEAVREAVRPANFRFLRVDADNIQDLLLSAREAYPAAAGGAPER